MTKTLAPIPFNALSNRMDIDTINTLFGLDVPFMVGGSARGYNVVADVLTQTTDGRDLNVIWSEFQRSIQLANQYRQRLIDLLTYPVTAPTEEVPQMSGDDFEEASEFGVPRGIRGAAYFSLGFDFKWYDVAVRYTWMYLAEATSAQVESLHNQVLDADSRLLLSKVLKAIFNNANRAIDIRGNAVAVYPFYNGDGTVPPQYKNQTFDGTHTHYFTSGAAVVDSGDLDDMYTKLSEHGYSIESGGQAILLANNAQVRTIRGFRMANGASYDFIPSTGAAGAILVPPGGTIIGGQPPAQYQGLNVAGQYGPWLVVPEDYIPAGYMFGFVTGGDRQATNPVGLREHANASLRGLRLVKGREPDYPLIDSYYNHGFGTGVRHRGAGVVIQITTNAAYAPPNIP